MSSSITLDTGNLKTHINDDYTVSDSHIAIVRKNSCETGMIIYIYELRTDGSEDNFNTETNINTQTRIRRLKYCSGTMDTNYSKYYMSLSSDGNYLAISWLPNPRMGVQQSMRYCDVYYLASIPFEDALQIQTDEQMDMLPTLPIQLIEFHGACVFMTSKKLALLNRNQVRVYQLEQRAENDVNTKIFSLDFSVDLSLKSGNVALFPGYNYCRFTNTYALVSSNSTTAAVDEDSTNLVPPVPENTLPRSELVRESPDDIPGFNCDMTETDIDDNRCKDQHIDELDMDIDHNDEEELYVDVFSNNDIVINMGDYEIFCEEQHFIKSNIATIKSAGVINTIVNKQKDLLLWSLRERRLIFFDELDSMMHLAIHNTDKEEQHDLIFAFSPRQNMLAFTRRYRHLRDISKLIDNAPVLHVRDTESGTVISQLHLPPTRLIAGISQIEFLQDGMYIMIISYSHLTCYFDLYDVASESHLDSFSFEINNHVNVDKCVFILNKQMPLRHGCGTFILATHSAIITNCATDKSGKIMDKCIMADTFFVNSIRYEFKNIGFFKDAFENFNRCHGSNCCNEQNVLWTLTKMEESSDIHVLRHTRSRHIEKERTGKSCPAYFLDTGRNYLVTYTQLHEDSSPSALTIWRITSPGEIWQGKEVLLIRLEEIVYCFTQNVKHSLSTIAGYPSILYNLTCFSRGRINRMNPVVVRPNNAEGIPVLIIKLNDTHDMLDYAGIYSRFGKVDQLGTVSQQFTLAIPLNSYTTLECHLHALANECESFVNTKKMFLRNDLAKIPRRLLCTRSTMITWENLEQLIEKNQGYFSTLSGYATLCRLARSDTYHDLLSKILQPSTIVNYCVLARTGVYTEKWYTDPLLEAISTGAKKNVALIKRHNEQSVARHGLKYAVLLIKHHKLLSIGQ